MPGLDGISAAAELARELPETRTLILTTFGRPGYLRRAIEAGAGGFLLKDAPADQLADAIREVNAGRRVIDPGLAAAAIADGVSPSPSASTTSSPRRRTHATAAEIAAHLYLSEGTVRNYLSAAIRKLGARNRAEAITIAETRAGSSDATRLHRQRSSGRTGRPARGASAVARHRPGLQAIEDRVGVLGDVLVRPEIERNDIDLRSTSRKSGLTCCSKLTGPSEPGARPARPGAPWPRAPRPSTPGSRR